MEEYLDLNKSYLNSMHDQIVDTIEIIEDNLILNYESLQHTQSNFLYNKCKIIFKNIDAPYVEVIKERKCKGKMRLYYIEEFLSLMKRKKYMLQTLYYYVGYDTVFIDGRLLNRKHSTISKCYFIIPANKVLYKWMR
ncbi:MAG: hypothetical protein HFJ06_08675 [Lachnospiraceae bacterium]|nr:hypothetical protein [Lachnospiraceae bacterium]